MGEVGGRVAGSGFAGGDGGVYEDEDDVERKGSWSEPGHACYCF